MGYEQIIATKNTPIQRVKISFKKYVCASLADFLSFSKSSFKKTTNKLSLLQSNYISASINQLHFSIWKALINPLETDDIDDTL